MRGACNAGGVGSRLGLAGLAGSGSGRLGRLLGVGRVDGVGLHISIKQGRTVSLFALPGPAPPPINSPPPLPLTHPPASPSPSPPSLYPPTFGSPLPPSNPTPGVPSGRAKGEKGGVCDLRSAGGRGRALSPLSGTRVRSHMLALFDAAACSLRVDISPARVAINTVSLDERACRICALLQKSQVL